jgi:hypothetical protein
MLDERPGGDDVVIDPVTGSPFARWKDYGFLRLTLRDPAR